MYKLVLIRHGESTWNKENRFTGWVDVDLTEQGNREARQAGQLLKEAGYTFDIAYTSVLKRALRDEANAYLNAVQKNAELSAAYVMNARGETLAASNSNEPGSFIGSNYAFRPYFADAMKRGFGRLLWRRQYHRAGRLLSGRADP
ncbi:hypothetical protein SY87_00005 [Burkholderia pseudomallei]|nr:hypothetical protein SY87_00005 [Burkholderia pseudomallei]